MHFGQNLHTLSGENQWREKNLYKRTWGLFQWGKGDIDFGLEGYFESIQ